VFLRKLAEKVGAWFLSRIFYVLLKRYFEVVPFSFSIFFVIVLFHCSAIDVEARAEVIYLHAFDAGGEGIKYVHVIFALSWFPFKDGHRLAHTDNLNKASRGTAFGVATDACEVL